MRTTELDFRRAITISVLLLMPLAACSAGQPGPSRQVDKSSPSATESEERAVATRQAPQLVLQSGRFYVRWSPRENRPAARIASVRDMRALDIASAGQRLYWRHEVKKPIDSSIRRVSLTGRHQRTLLRRSGPMLDLAATREFVFWGAPGAIGRASVDGTRVRRTWLAFSRPGRGQIEDGLATDGRFLYLSQCVRGRIGRVALSARPAQRRVEWIVRTDTCPGPLAVDGGFVYWAGFSRTGEGVIGRAPAAGGSPDNTWTPVRTFEGPNDVAVAGDFVYWTWGGSGARASRKYFLGRVRVDGTNFDRMVRNVGGSLITAINH